MFRLAIKEKQKSISKSFDVGQVAKVRTLLRRFNHCGDTCENGTSVSVSPLRGMMQSKVAVSVSVTCEIRNSVTQFRRFPFICHKFYGHFPTKLCLEPCGISEVMLNYLQGDGENSNELSVCALYIRCFRLMVKQCEKNLDATWTFVSEKLRSHTFLCLKRFYYNSDLLFIVRNIVINKNNGKLISK